MKHRLAYLCLEAPREGQASYVHAHEIIAGLCRRGWDVELIAPSYSSQWRRPPLFRRALHYLRLQLSLAFRLRTFDALYVRGHPLAWPIAMLASALRKPTVHEINGIFDDVLVAYPSARTIERMLVYIQRAQYKKASALVTVTDRLADWARREARPVAPYVSVIPNGANTDIFHPAAKCEYQLSGHYAVFVGGLTPWHGIAVMLDAVASPQWPSDLNLVIAGDGPEMPKIAAAASRDSRIMPLGRVPYRSVPGILAGASMGLVPITDPMGRSSAAGLSPLKLYEVMACGVPVVVSDFPGQADLVRQEECGLVVPESDPVALARAVAELHTDREGSRSKGHRGLQAARERHSWDARAATTDDLLRHLITSASRGHE